MNRIVLVALLALISVVGLGGYLFFQSLAEGFPELGPGTYAGQIVYAHEDRAVPWIVQRPAVGRKLWIALGEPTIPAQDVSLPEPTVGTGLPLIIAGTDIRFRFVGRQAGGDMYGGTFENPLTGAKGDWTLKKFVVADLDTSLDADLQAWTVLAHELGHTEQRINDAQAKFDSQRVKLEKLSRFIVDEDSLRAKADTRYGVTNSAISEARTKLDELRTQLDAAVRNVELSHRISPRGRLALLARESLQRESRWVEIGLNLLAPQTSLDFERDLERANRVKQIMDEIDTERRLIAELQAGERYKGEAAETDVEEEFYRGIGQE